MKKSKPFFHVRGKYFLWLVKFDGYFVRRRGKPSSRFARGQTERPDRQRAPARRREWLTSGGNVCGEIDLDAFENASVIPFGGRHSHARIAKHFVTFSANYGMGRMYFF